MLCTGKDAHIFDMHNKLGLLTLHERRHLHLGFETYKTINTDSNIGLKKCYVPVKPVHGRKMRSTA